MPTPVHAAARRLRGHLIDTPLIGEIRLPGFAVAPGVRVKAECLQTAGGAWYRGYLHYLLRSLGRFKGLVLHGDDPMLLAQAFAGVFHRLPMVAVCGAGQAESAARVQSLGVEVVTVADEVGGAARERAQADGFHCLPGVADPVIAEGIATLGLELADQLPSDVTRSVTATEAFAAPIREGFAAAARDCEVVAATAAPFPPEWREAVAQGLRVLTDDAGLTALWQERVSDAPTCVVI